MPRNLDLFLGKNKKKAKRVQKNAESVVVFRKMNLLAMWKIRYNWRLRKPVSSGQGEVNYGLNKNGSKERDGRGKIFRKYLHLVWHNVKSVQEMSYQKMDYVKKHLWKGYAADRAGWQRRTAAAGPVSIRRAGQNWCFFCWEEWTKVGRTGCEDMRQRVGVWWGSKWKNPEVRLFSGSCSSGGLCGVQALGAPKLRVLGEGRKLNQSVGNINCSYWSVRTKQFS